VSRSLILQGECSANHQLSGLACKLLVVPWFICNLVVACRALNVPTKLLDALDMHKLMHQLDPLLIQLSTDQACLSHGRSGLCTKHQPLQTIVTQTDRQRQTSLESAHQHCMSK